MNNSRAAFRPAQLPHPAALQTPARAIPADKLAAAGRRAGIAVLQQHHLVGEFRGEPKFVRHDHDRVAILLRQLPQALAAIPLARRYPDAAWARRAGSARGCCASARARITRCFSPPESSPIERSRKCSAPTCASALRGDQQVLFGFESQRPPVRIAALQNKIPNAHGKQHRAFLMHHRDALRARSQRRAGWFPRRRVPRVRKAAAKLRRSAAAAWICRWRSGRGWRRFRARALENFGPKRKRRRDCARGADRHSSPARRCSRTRSFAAARCRARRRAIRAMCRARSSQSLAAANK